MLFTAVLIGLATIATAQEINRWTELEPGLELRWVLAKTPSGVGDSRIAVIRVDPARWEFVLASRSQVADAPCRTVREWAGIHDFKVAINAGMYATDYKTHVGYMESQGHVNSSGVNDYLSVAAFDPRDPAEHPHFRIFDLDEPGVSLESVRESYGSLMQNLRLIKRSGENRWSQQDRKWSEAALGEDKDGKVLLVFSRSPFSMHDLNKELLAAGIGLVALQHLEGGPEAQLYVKAGAVELDLCGSFETSFMDNDGNAAAWPIPNALGIRPRAADD